MIITRTPYRISFCGGGTDYPAWYKDHGGAVLNTTIDRYCYISVRRMPPFLGTKYRIAWSRLETVNFRRDIEHAGVRGCLEFLDFEDGIEVNHAGDLPARSGLGSSSAFTVGMLNALHVLRGETVSAAKLAEEAIAVEQNVLQETVGIQDQIACAWGGLNMIEIDAEGGYGIIPIVLPEDRIEALESRLMLYYTGIQRHASEIAKAQIENTERNTDYLKCIAAQVPEAAEILRNGELDRFGVLLNTAWCFKRQLSDKISSPEIDRFYDAALSAGALGGKVLGAGGGGFMLFYVPPEHQAAVRGAVGLFDIPVKFESGGSQVVLS